MADNFSALYDRLRAVMLAAAPDMKVNRDAPGSLELRTPEIDPKTKQLGWFGMIAVKKTYVSYHLMPLYTAPELAEKISPALAKRKQGKTCFNFVQLDEVLFKELARLTKACAAAARK